MRIRPFFILIACLAAAPAMTAQAQETPAQKFQAAIGLARVKRDAGDFAAARKYFEDARRLRPFTAAEAAEYFWALAGHDSSAALAAGRDALAKDPANQPVRDRAITEAQNLGDETAVLALADAGKGQNARTALWPRRMAESYLRQRQPSAAADAYLEATKQSDSVSSDRVGLAVALEAAKRYSESAAAWSSVAARDRQGRSDLEHSRLRALVLGGAPSAGAELDQWLSAHADDAEVRALAVDFWSKSGQPARALSVIDPLISGADAGEWLRRKAGVARAAGRIDDAISALGQIATKQLTAADRVILAELLLDAKQFDRAVPLLRSLASGSKCDTHTLELIDRVPGAAGTALLLNALAPSACDPQTTWLRRAIERAEAASQHADALKLISRLPAAAAAEPAMQRLTGELRFWTGDTAGAIRTLETALVGAPNDVEARETLVDAYRSARRPMEAWRVAEPLLSVSGLSETRRDVLAELALEVDRQDVAVRMIESSGKNSPARTQLLGRALLADGRPAEAVAELTRIPANSLTATGALALIDAIEATAGTERSRVTAAQFTNTSADWREVIARRVRLEATTGHPEEAARLRAILAGIDPQAALLADVEIALAAGHAQQALVLIAALPNDPQSDRVAELEIIARTGAGDFAGALAIVERLRAHRPASVSLQIRAAELHYRTAPTAEHLAAIVNLQKTHRSNRDATLAAARALADAGRRAEALSVLSPTADWAALPSEARVLAARWLRAEGRSREALAALPEAGASTPGTSGEELALLRAELAPTVEDRTSILTEAAARFPENALLQTRLATAAWAAGRHDVAVAAADRAVAVNPAAIDAWLVLVDGAGSGPALDQVLYRFEQVQNAQPAIVLSMSERLSAFVRGSDDPLVARVIGWLDAIQPADAQTAFARDIASARVLAAAERWTESLSAVDAALRADAQSAAALKLRAELLSWSGRHADAVIAYDRYLARQPDDVDARRQQARVAGWGGRYAQAEALYAALRSAYPDDKRVAAEAAAKTAYFEGRWHDAAAAYGTWLELEPDNGEARFEQAESLRAAGDIAAADQALVNLAAATGHRLAKAAIDRERVRRGATAEVVGDSRSSAGYGGQRLLNVQHAGAQVRTTIGALGRTTFAAAAGSLALSAGDVSLRGYRVAGLASFNVTSRIGFHARATGWNLSSSNDVSIDGAGALIWRVTDRWSLTGGWDRESIFENLMTVDRRLQAQGPFGEVAFESPRSTLSARLTRQDLSDNNSRRRITVSATRALSERLKEVRAVIWAESLAYRTAATDYFSPSRQLRADAGLQYAHQLLTPRFRNDRQQTFALSYLIGTDDRGATYHHPMLSLAVEFANGVAIDARASWIRSSVYRESSVFAGISFHPHARVR